MKTMGRPRRNGRKKPKHFLRALMIIDAYSKARAEGTKHSVAVRETVEAIKKLAPGMPISETEVKRVVAELSPRGGPIALTVEASVLEGEEAARLRRFHADMLEQTGIKEITNQPDSDPQRPLKRFAFGFDTKPRYPRHNAKTPQS